MGQGGDAGAAPNEGRAERPLPQLLMHPRPPGLAGRLNDWWSSRVQTSVALSVYTYTLRNPASSHCCLPVWRPSNESPAETEWYLSQEEIQINDIDLDKTFQS